MDNNQGFSWWKSCCSGIIMLSCYKSWELNSKLTEQKSENFKLKTQLKHCKLGSELKKTFGDVLNK